ncbi:MAG TPA: A24 family peptidase [Candidatus Dormibacteraeota bacterium]|nr:A24 family peptidase [Candidatus Dormibacteraeota bacterium]
MISSGSLVMTLLWTVVGAAVGWFVRWGSVRLAKLEDLDLEPGNKPWQVYGPPVLCALLFGIFAFHVSSFPMLALRSVFVAVLVQVIFFDFEYRLILDRVMFPSMALALLVSLSGDPWFSGHDRWHGIATGLGAGLLFLLLAIGGSLIFKTEAMGFGDVKLVTFIGFLLGPLPTAQALFYGVFLAGVGGVTIIIWRRSMKGTIAYGPYLAAGTLIALFQLPQ